MTASFVCKRALSNVAIIAQNSWKESRRSRFYLLSISFGALFLYVSLILGALAVDQEMRVLVDFGLGFIELLGLAAALHGSCTMVLREVETKTIHLILTRPVGRGQYLIGRFLGLMAAVLVSVILMALIHIAILLGKGWKWDSLYLAALSGTLVKIWITASLGLFLSVFSTSALAAFCFTAGLWTLGHFLPEVRWLLARRVHGPMAIPLKGLTYVVPNLQIFNIRDRLTKTSFSSPEPSLRVWIAYSSAYSLTWLALARQWFSRKEL